MDGQPRKWTRRCMVEGCREYGVPVVTTEPPVDTRDPRSHYAMNHAQPADVWPDSFIYLRRKT